jgi:anti-sigma factor RsiW
MSETPLSEPSPQSADGAGAPTVSATRPALWRRRPVRAAAAMVIAVGVIGGTVVATEAPTTIHVKGDIQLSFNVSPPSLACEVAVPADIHSGAAVFVKTADGHTLGAAPLGVGQVEILGPDHFACTFGFDVPVRGGEPVYLVTVSNRAPWAVTPDQVADATLSLRP